MAWWQKIPWKKLFPVLALALLLLICGLLSDSFLNPRNLSNVLRQVSYTGTIALGMTFVIVAAGIDLSVGSMTAFIGILTLMALNALLSGDNPFLSEGMAVSLAVVLSLVLGLTFGAINSMLITVGRITAFIATLGTMSIFRSLTTYVSDAQEISCGSELLYDIGGGYFLGLPIPVLCFLALTAIGHLLLHHTPFGRHVCALGSNEEVARFSAIRVQRVRFLTYLISGACVGISSLMLASRLGAVSPGDTGHFYELDAIAAVVIGGTPLSGGRGSILGTAIGAILLGVIDNMLNLMDVSPYLQGSVKGGVILVAVMVHYKKK